jgi:hypothetical protein
VASAFYVEMGGLNALKYFLKQRKYAPIGHALMSPYDQDAK